MPPGVKIDSETPKINAGFGWILLAISVSVLAIVIILLWRARKQEIGKKSENEDKMN